MREVFRLEWRTALARRRLLIWNLVVPLLLLAPVALSPAAAPHRAAVYAVFFVFFGTFGSAIPLIRDARNGWNEKLLLTGYGSRPWLYERLGAGTTIDLVQLIPSVALIAVAASAGPGSSFALFAALVLALLFANILGAVVAALVRSLAEAALGCAVVALFALHFAGAFRAAPTGGWAELVQRVSPFRPLVEATRSMAVTGSAPPAVVWLWPVVSVAAALILVVLAAPRIARRLSGAEF